MILIKAEYNGHLQTKEVIDENGIVWKLDGSCIQCGQCCINPKYNAGYNDDNGRCEKLITEKIDGVDRHYCSMMTN